MSWQTSVYRNPEKFGLTQVGEIEWSIPSYDFDLTVVWRDAQGKLYWADDSGCSCPAPFEDYESVESLTTGTWVELDAHLKEVVSEMGPSSRDRNGSHFEPQIVELMARVTAKDS